MTATVPYVPFFSKIVPVDPSALQIAVDAGVALLDERLPGWYKRVQLDRLEMSDPTACVISQITSERYGSVGLEALGVSLGEAYRFGFNLPPVIYNFYGEFMSPYWKLLTEAWVRAVKRKVEGG